MKGVTFIRGISQKEGVMEEKIKHLEFIQTVISRMNTNSFQTKGIAASIVVGILLVLSSTKNIVFIIPAICSTILFSLLDTYYLQQEKKFKAIYDNVIGIKKAVTIEPFEMPLDRIKVCYISVLFSKTIILFYGSVVLTLGLVGIIFFYTKN